MHRISIAILVVLLFALSGFAMTAQENTPEAEPSEAPVVITLERTACYGTCPVYEVKVYEDGTVWYNGLQFVNVEGVQTFTLEAGQVETLVDAFVEIGYLEWQDEYTTHMVSDMPTVITSVTIDGETKRIEHYEGDDSVPLALIHLEAWLDQMLYTNQWTGSENDAISLAMFNEAVPLITLERGPCLGTCPVYSVVLYDDGTVIYTGIAYVDAIGVRESHIEPASISLLADRMNNISYFDWQDAYDTYIVSDMSTITTSVMIGWDRKIITRYDGDPYAPIGLVRFEDEIDQLAYTAQWVGEE